MKGPGLCGRLSDVYRALRAVDGLSCDEVRLSRIRGFLCKVADVNEPVLSYCRREELKRLVVVASCAGVEQGGPSECFK